MTRPITCIECPVGCRILVTVENGKVVKISGNKCPKGDLYSVSEIENPARILTSTVATRGMPLVMLPVRTDGPIPKTKLLEAMDEIRKIVVDRPVRTGEVIVKNFLQPGVNLIVTRDSSPDQSPREGCPGQSARSIRLINSAFDRTL